MLTNTIPFSLVILNVWIDYVNSITSVGIELEKLQPVHQKVKRRTSRHFHSLIPRLLHFCFAIHLNLNQPLHTYQKNIIWVHQIWLKILQYNDLKYYLLKLNEKIFLNYITLDVLYNTLHHLILRYTTDMDKSNIETVKNAFLCKDSCFYDHLHKLQPSIVVVWDS